MRKSHRTHLIRYALIGIAAVISIGSIFAQNIYEVTNGASSGVGSLLEAIQAANASSEQFTINVDPGLTIDPSAQMIIGLYSNNTVGLTINGNGSTINMAGQDRAFFIASGNVSINNLTIQSGNATGGNGADGGGGGAGLGGAIFVANPAAVANGAFSPNLTLPTAVTLQNVSFVNNQAVGGAGGVPTQNLGGGGGMGGNGAVGYVTGSDSSGGGGGGFGKGANGGAASEYGDAGSVGAMIFTTTGGGSGGYNGAAGGQQGGGGGGGNDGFFEPGAGGGGGVSAGSANGGNGGNGGFGGGGGGGGIQPNFFSQGDYPGGSGGFGGGGGAGQSTTTTEQTGGFGGGGGGVFTPNPATIGGFGGGQGYYGGGGGAGLGGAIFVMSGASLQIIQTTNSPLFSSNGVVAGTGSVAGSNNGSAYGSDLFLGGNTIFNVTTSLTLNSLGGAGNTADPNVSQAANDPNAQGGVTLIGGGTLTLTGSNYYSGATVINSGTLTLAPNMLEQGTSQVIVGQTNGDNGTLALGSSSTLNVNSGTNPAVIVGQNSGSTGTVIIGGGAGSSGAFLGLNQINGGPGGGSILFEQNNAAGNTSPSVYPVYSALTGNLQVVQNGPGTTLLQPFAMYGSNTFSGGILVNQGSLQIGTNTALPAGETITVNGGAFDMYGWNSPVLGTVTLNNGTLADSAGGGGLSASIVNAASGTIAVTLTGEGDFSKTGSGTVIIATNANYSGTTILHDGTVNIGNGISLNGTSQLIIGQNSGDNATMILGSGSTLGLSAFTNSTDAPILLGASNGSTGVLQIGTGRGSSGAYIAAHTIQGGTGGGSVVFDQALDAAGTSSIYPFYSNLQGNLSLIQNGPGTSQLSPSIGANNYTGSTLVNGGELEADSTGALGQSTNITINEGGILLLHASSVVSGNKIMALNGGTLALSGNQAQNFGTWNILSNSITDFGGSASTLVFSGLSINASLSIWNWNTNDDTILIAGAPNASYYDILFYSDSGTTEIGTGAILNGELQAVPEPSAYALFGIGVLAMVIAVRRQKA